VGSSGSKGVFPSRQSDFDASSELDDVIGIQPDSSALYQLFTVDPSAVGAADVLDVPGASNAPDDAVDTGYQGIVDGDGIGFIPADGHLIDEFHPSAVMDEKSLFRFLNSGKTAADRTFAGYGFIHSRSPPTKGITIPQKHDWRNDECPYYNRAHESQR
jgi:hypothetical protein